MLYSLNKLTLFLNLMYWYHLILYRMLLSDGVLSNQYLNSCKSIVSSWAIQNSKIPLIICLSSDFSWIIKGVLELASTWKRRKLGRSHYFWLEIIFLLQNYTRIGNLSKAIWARYDKFNTLTKKWFKGSGYVF